MASSLGDVDSSVRKLCGQSRDRHRVAHTILRIGAGALAGSSLQKRHRNIALLNVTQLVSPYNPGELSLRWLSSSTHGRGGEHGNAIESQWQQQEELTECLEALFVESLLTVSETEAVEPEPNRRHRTHLRARHQKRLTA